MDRVRVIFFYHRLACRTCSWQHRSSVYKLAPWARVFACLQSGEGEGSCRVRSLSHVAFLSVFRLLSGSSVRLIIMKQSPHTPFRLRKKGKKRHWSLRVEQRTKRKATFITIFTIMSLTSGDFLICISLNVICNKHTHTILCTDQKHLKNSFVQKFSYISFKLWVVNHVIPHRTWNLSENSSWSHVFPTLEQVPETLTGFLCHICLISLVMPICIQSHRHLSAKPIVALLTKATLYLKCANLASVRCRFHIKMSFLYLIVFVFDSEYYYHPPVTLIKNK